jgi:hypothetical protein
MRGNHHGQVPVRKIRRDGVTQRYWVTPPLEHIRTIMKHLHQHPGRFTNEQVTRLFQSPRFTEPIHQYLIQFNDNDAIRGAIQILHPYIERGNPEVIRFLMHMATESPNALVRRWSIDALVRVSADGPRLALEVMEKAPTEDDKRYAIDSLTEFFVFKLQLLQLAQYEQESKRQTKEIRTVLIHALDILADALLGRWFTPSPRDGYWHHRLFYTLSQTLPFLDEHVCVPATVKHKVIDGITHCIAVGACDYKVAVMGQTILERWQPKYALQKLFEIAPTVQDPHIRQLIEDTISNIQINETLSKIQTEQIKRRQTKQR